MFFSRICAAVLAANVVSLVTAERVPVTGVQTGIDRNTGEVPARRNINEIFGAGGPTFTLYVRALKALQEMDPRDTKSYFQISGIHGLPVAEWNEAGPQVSSSWGGYCSHGEDIFIPWHRHYLSLYEQVLVEKALQIAEEYPTSVRSEYRQAAERLRAPYWDWADNPDLPPCVTTQQIAVLMPNGDGVQSTTIQNPLYSFVWPQAALNGEFGFVPDARETRRCPDRSGRSNAAESNRRLRARNFRPDVYNTFVRATTYNQAGSTAQEGSNFEMAHNNVHTAAACGGDFADSNVAGFDPLFALHHCNVDRLFSLWQFRYPSEAMFTWTYQANGAFSTRDGSAMDPDTPLRPFYRDQSSFHTSNSARNIQDFGYTYPGVQYWNRSPEQLTTDVTALVNNLYGSGTQRSKRTGLTKRATKMEYFAKVKFDLEKVPKPCAMNIYLGGKLAGTASVLGLPVRGSSYSEVPLENVVVKQGLRSRRKKVTNLIKKNLQVEFAKPDGTIIDPSQVSGYTIEIEEAPVVLPQKLDEFPKYGEGKLEDATADITDVIKSFSSLVESAADFFSSTLPGVQFDEDVA